MDPREAAVTYRAARSSDAARLAVVARDSFVETFGHTYRPDDLATFLAESYSPDVQRAELEDPTQRTQLALDAAGDIVGFVTLSRLTVPAERPVQPALELRRLYVVRAWHGRGVAAHLMTWCLDEARAAGAAALYLGVWRHNARAQRFYARYGMRKVGEYLFAVGSHRDEEDILMVRLP